MKSKILYFFIINLISISLFGQTFKLKDKERFIHYLDSSEALDPIEGIWSLNVINTLFDKEGKVLGQSIDESRSEWAIKRVDKLRFNVYDIGKSGKNQLKFHAYFETTAIEELYTYTCQFKNPKWVANANVAMNDMVSLEYEYFVSDTGMKSIYKTHYREGLRLHWRFIWIKKYPAENF